MPTFELANTSGAAASLAPSDSVFFTPAGVVSSPTGQADADLRAIARSAYTLAKLLIRVLVNDTTADSTARSRNQGANGNQSATVGAGLTGTFQDTVNTDAIASGDAFNGSLVVGSGGSQFDLNYLGWTLAHASADDSILMSSAPNGGQSWPTAVRWGFPAGQSVNQTPEDSYALTFRMAATLSNLRVSVDSNTTLVDETLTSRKNLGAGAQTLTVTAGATGGFEDTTNTDSLVAGDEWDYEMSAETGAGGIQYQYTQAKCLATHRIRATTGNVAFAADSFMHVEGNNQAVLGAESTSQAEVRAGFNAEFGYVRVPTHGATSGVDFFLRKDGANTALTMNAPASTTGTFEDTTNSVALVTGDDYGWFLDHGGGAGSITTSMVSLSGDAVPAAARSRVLTAV